MAPPASSNQLPGSASPQEGAMPSRARLCGGTQPSASVGCGLRSGREGGGGRSAGPLPGASTPPLPCLGASHAGGWARSPSRQAAAAVPETAPQQRPRAAPRRPASDGRAARSAPPPPGGSGFSAPAPEGVWHAQACLVRTRGPSHLPPSPLAGCPGAVPLSAAGRGEGALCCSGGATPAWPGPWPWLWPSPGGWSMVASAK